MKIRINTFSQLLALVATSALFTTACGGADLELFNKTLGDPIEQGDPAPPEEPAEPEEFEADACIVAFEACIESGDEGCEDALNECAGPVVEIDCNAEYQICLDEGISELDCQMMREGCELPAEEVIEDLCMSSFEACIESGGENCDAELNACAGPVVEVDCAAEYLICLDHGISEVDCQMMREDCEYVVEELPEEELPEEPIF